MAFSSKELIKNAWQIYKAHALSLIVIYTTVLAVLWFVRNIFPQIIQLPQAYGWLLALANFLVQAFLGLGIVYMALKIETHRAPSWRDFSARVDSFFQFAFLLFVISLLFYGGLYFGILPGILLLPFVVLAPYIFVTEKLGIFAALKRSVQLSKGYRLQIIFFELLLFAIIFLSGFTLVGLLVSVPLAYLANAELYQALKCMHDESCNKYKKEELNPAVSLVTYIVLLAFAVYGAWLLYARFSVSQDLQQNLQEAQANLAPATNANLEKVKLAIELYKDLNGAYPKNLQELLNAQIIEDTNLLYGLTYSKTQDGFKLCNANICVEGNDSKDNSSTVGE